MADITDLIAAFGVVFALAGGVVGLFALLYWGEMLWEDWINR